MYISYVIFWKLKTETISISFGSYLNILKSLEKRLYNANGKKKNKKTKKKPTDLG